MLGIEPEYLIGMKPAKMDEEVKSDVELSNRKIKKAESKLAPSPRKGSGSNSEGLEEEDDEDGQIKLPLDVVRRTEELQANELYQIVYLRHKTEEELSAEQQVY